MPGAQHKVMTPSPDPELQDERADSDVLDTKNPTAGSSKETSNSKPKSSIAAGSDRTPDNNSESLASDRSQSDDGPSSSPPPAAKATEAADATESTEVAEVAEVAGVAGVEKDPTPGARPNKSDAPPLPDEPVPAEIPEQDDGWECMWSQDANSWYFYNRFTQQTQWDNPRVPTATSGAPDTSPAPASTSVPAQPPLPPAAVGGYNPAIHGDYDPTADYAQGYRAAEEGIAGGAEGGADPSLLYISGGFFNRATGQFQHPEQGSERHGDEAKSQRQMGAFFDVDAAANSHDGRSLKAERSGKKPSKAELKAFKEKRRARKEEKRRAWLRD